MKKLHKRIAERYHDSEELIALIVKYKLNDKIEKAIKKIEECFNKGWESKFPTLAGIILTDFNTTIHTIEKESERRKVKYFIAELFDDYLKRIAQLPNGSEILKGISKTLENTSSYQDYDFQDLSNLIQIDKWTVLLPKRMSTNAYYYDWQAQPHELDGLAKDLADKKIIYSVKEFKKLFIPLESTITVRFNRSKIEYCIILFLVLKELRLLKPRGTSGYFAPFVQHSVDNEYNFLIKNKINKEHSRIKLNAPKYTEIKEELELLIMSQIKPIRTMDGQ